MEYLGNWQLIRFKSVKRMKKNQRKLNLVSFGMIINLKTRLRININLVIKVLLISNKDANKPPDFADP